MSTLIEQAQKTKYLRNQITQNITEINKIELSSSIVFNNYKVIEVYGK